MPDDNLAYYDLIKSSMDEARLLVFLITQDLESFRKKRRQIYIFYFQKRIFRFQKR